VRVSTWVWAKHEGFVHKKAGKDALAPCILDVRGTQHMPCWSHCDPYVWGLYYLSWLGLSL